MILSEQREAFRQVLLFGKYLVLPFAPAKNTTTMRRQSLQVFLDIGNIVQDYEFSDNTSDINQTTSAFGAHTEQTTTSNLPPDNPGK